MSELAMVGEAAALATAVCWAVSALFFQSAGLKIGSLNVNLLRLVIGFVLLTAGAWVIRGIPLPLDADADAWLWLSLSGVAGFVFGDLCLFRAYVVLGPRLSSAVMASAPPMTAAIGWIALDERLGGRELLGMALTIAGISWAVLERSPLPGQPRRPVLGLLLAFGGAVGQAAGLVLSKVGMRAYDPLPATQIRILAGVVGFTALFSVLRRWRDLGRAIEHHSALMHTSFGALFGPVIGVTLSLVAVKNTQAGIAASIMATTPILIIPLVVLVRRERVGIGGIAGAVLAVAGVTLLFS